LYNDRDLSIDAKLPIAAQTDFGEKPAIPETSINPMKLRLLNPTLEDIKGILRMDIF
jgi:hypothetical protein